MGLVSECEGQSSFLAKTRTGLDHRSPPDKVLLLPLQFSGMTINKPLRSVGLFAFNCLIAIGGTAVITSEIHFNQHELQTYAFKVDIADSVGALALGYFVYRRWQYSAAKWIWVAGFCWWIQRALALWLQQHWRTRRHYVREPIGILGYVRSWMPLRQTKLHRLDALHDLVAAGMLLFGGRVVV